MMIPLGSIIKSPLLSLHMQPCPAGTFQPYTDQAICFTCNRGTFSSTPGSISCLLCPLDTYADTDGSPICQVWGCGCGLALSLLCPCCTRWVDFH